MMDAYISSHETRTEGLMAKYPTNLSQEHKGVKAKVFYTKNPSHCQPSRFSMFPPVCSQPTQSSTNVVSRYCCTGGTWSISNIKSCITSYHVMRYI